MNINLLENIEITDEDIDWVEELLKDKDIKFYNCRREIIKNLQTVNIQAFPGTGKTTVLVAKLAILARKWPYANFGICVLSHTNVAREEIENRLGKTSVGKKLLSYPHYIGTIHSFFDTFVAIPWLRSQGKSIKIIDSDTVHRIRWNRLSQKAKFCLQKIRQNENNCEAVELPLKIKIGNIGETTTTYKNVVGIVAESHEKGEYTFNEMLLYAKEALQHIPNLTEYIATRFPILFIDELQDTSETQWELINQTFRKANSNVICQYFGDSNQAIYNSIYSDETDIELHGTVKYNIPNSKRFGESIASLANTLALSNQKMTGEQNEFDRLADKHTIFLFDKHSISSVITAYAKHILSCFSDNELFENEEHGCHVIGMVHRENDDDKMFPRSVCDYWCGYEPALSSHFSSPQNMISYFRMGQKAFLKNGNTNEFIDWVSRGLRHYFNMFNNYKISRTTDTFKALCNELQEDEEKLFRKFFLRVIAKDLSNKRNWSIVTKSIIRMTEKLFKIEAVRNDFLSWEPVSDNTDIKKACNTFLYVDHKSGRSVPLHFGSIHSVKGRTHLSTMVVETYWYKPNIKSLFPWLCHKSKRKPEIQNRKRMKCHYVAFSRARALLCVALPKDEVTEEVREDLSSFGWNVVDIG